MSRFFKRLVCAVIISAFVFTLLSIPAYAETGDCVEGEYIEGEVVVKLKNSADNDYLNTKKAASVYGKSLSIESKSDLGDDLRFVTLKSSRKTTLQLMSSLKNDENIECVMPNSIKHACSLSDDKYSDYQWALQNNGQFGGTKGYDIAPSQLWNSAASDKSEKVVAVIDSGIDLEHEDLKDSLWTNPYPDQLMGEHGYDFTRTVPSREPVDDDGHGTHISGIIAASSNNQKGVRGVAQPNVKIMSLKASTDGNFSTSHEIKAFEYIEKAIKLGVNVVAVNCSYGGESNITEKEFYDDIFDKLGSLGAVTCVASGNEYADLDDHKNGLYLLPACTDSKYAITVAGVDEKNDIASFSNTSSKYVDIAAPGTNILSTVSYNSFNPSIYDTEQLDNTTDLFLDFNNESAQDVGQYVYTYGETGGVNLKISDDFAGLSGHALSFTPQRIGDMYCVEIPYTRSNGNYNYKISFMAKLLEDCDCFFADVPVDYDVFDNFDEIEDMDLYFGTYGSNSWDHYEFDMGPSYSYYTKAVERKLVFLIYQSSSEFLLDDIGISFENPNPENFGKYDFMKGTSMSVPYVTGAVALIKSAYDVSAADTIKFIKDSALKLDGLKEYVEDGSVLNLGNASTLLKEYKAKMDKEKQDKAKQSVAKTSLSLPSYSKKLYVGKKYTVKPAVKNQKGAVSYKSLNPKVVSVSSKGVVKALKKGKATITVTNNGVKKTLSITVKNPKLNKKKLTLKKGKSFKLKIKGKTGKAKYKSLNKKIVKISGSGKLKALKKGTAVIKVVTNGKVKLKCKVKVS